MNIKKLMAGGAAIATGLATMVSAGFGQSINDPELDMAITWMHDNGMTSYDNEADFMPWGNLTREQAAKFTAGTETDGGWAEGNLCLTPVEDADCDFDDVPADPTLEGSVVKACLLGMVKGSNGMYYPTANITKAEFLTVIVRAIRAAAGEDPVMDESGNPWWSGYFAEARDLGLTKETDVFALDRPITRYESALILYRARIDSPECTDTVDWTDWLDDLLGDNDDDDDDMDDTDDDVVYVGDFDVSLNPETPKGATVPGNANVHVASFDIQADGDAQLKTIMLERVGLSSNKVIQDLSVSINGVVVTNTKSLNNDGTVSLSLKDTITLEDGEMVTVDVIAKVGDSATYVGQEFAIAIIGLNNGDVSPVVANEFTIGGVDASLVIVDVDTGTDTVQVGDKEVELAEFDIENDDDDYDVYITSITLEDDENEISNAAENFVLLHNGNVVATVERVTGKFLTFDLFDDPILIQDGDSETFRVEADIIAGVDDMINLIIDEEHFIQGYDTNFMFGLDVDVAGGTPGQMISIDAGEVALEEVHLDVDEIREDTDDNILAIFDLTINAGEDVEMDEIMFEFNWNGFAGAQPDDIFEEIELWMDGNREDVANIPDGSDYDLLFEDLGWNLESGTTYRVEIRGDTADNLDAYLTTTFNVEFAAGCTPGVSCTGIDLEADGETITDVTPSTMSFDTIELVEAGVFVSDLPMANVDVVIGSTLVDFLQFQIETDTVSAAKLRSITLDGTSNFDEDYINAITLWRETANGWVEIETENGNQIAGGDITLDGFTEEIPASSTEIFMVTIDITSSSNFTGNVAAQLTDMEIEDDDNDDIDVSAHLPLNSRTVNVIGEGSLDVTFDASNTLTDDDMFALGGSTSDYVAAFELSASDEDISIESMTLVVTGVLADFVGSVSRVWLFDEDGNSIYGNGAPVGSEVATNGGEVTFNNMNPELLVSADEDTIIYVALQTKTMGNGGTATVYGTDDFEFALEITEADGATSNVDILAGPSDYSNSVSIKPVLISDLELTDYNNAELTSAFQTIGTLTINTDTWTNRKAGSSSTAKLGLIEIALDCSAVNASGLRLQKTSGSDYVDATCNGGQVIFPLTGLVASSRVINSNSEASFHIKLDGNYTPVDGDSIALEFNTNNNSYVTYSEEDDTTCASDACVNEIRLGTSNLGTAEASNSN